ncbi:hypothetical protein LF915_06180 [Bifidobacterium pseudolongum]|uniref:hypothetical protein n=1 Tax=Bifidobacterium pseudolongum TaxID=1694 RepID=UPI001F10D179|nr:hypothetical protein [Bifidobacterium pseudolongum]MCH4842762.1 hypothetical protein [Bifidobacterium pseudolongum]
MKFLSVEVLTMIATVLGSNGVLYLIAKTMLTRWETKHPVVMRDDRVDELRAHVDELRSQVDELRDTQQILRAAVIELAYLLISDKHERYSKRGWAHPNEKRVVQRIYVAYHSLGGNGTGSELNREVQNMPSYPPDEHEPE